MPDSPPPEFVLPKPKRMTPWVKALLIVTLAFFLLTGAYIVLIVGLSKISIFEAVQVGCLGV